MHFSSLPGIVTLALAFQGGVKAAASEEQKLLDPCTISSSSGSFYDLRSLSVLPPDDGKKSTKGADRTESWHVKGYDYHSNFTLNICAPVVEDIDDVVGVNTKLWPNVSAFYESKGKTYSLGELSTDLTLRGKKLVLQYTNGSPCATSKISKRATISDDDDDDDYYEEVVRYKSTLISFICEKDPTAKQAAPSYVGTDPDECAYFFEVKSQHACGGSEPTKQGVGPGAVFTIIGVIAILVYFLGGVFYQRNVAHARGLRQLPNYSMWAGIGNFIKDIIIISISSCSRFFPSRRGYSALSISANGSGSSGGRGRGSRAEDENRLIDQLDEEWDD